MTDEHSYVAMQAIEHQATLASNAIQNAAALHAAPSAIYRPAISKDGDKWCALYGDNLQDGVAGFGDTPAAAMYDFDKNWNAA